MSAMEIEYFQLFLAILKIVDGIDEFTLFVEKGIPDRH
jgi:hypothetical protein